MKGKLIIFCVLFVATIVFLGACDPAVTVPIEPIAFDMDFNPVAKDVRNGRELAGLERVAVTVPAMQQLEGVTVQELLPQLEAVFETLLDEFDFEVFFSDTDYRTDPASLFAQGTARQGANQYSVGRNVPGLDSLLRILNQPQQQDTLFVSVRHNYAGEQPVRGQMNVTGNARVGVGGLLR